MTELIKINGVKGYVDKGTVYISLEDVARGLGFTQDKNDVEYIRWETVNSHLNSIGFSQQVGKGTFIPENIFYRLAMKAKNETAEIFQAKVADEILPSIRKHGMYATDELLDNPDLLIQVATELKKAREEKKLLQTETKLLAGETLQWTSRKVLEALVKKYGGKTGYAEAWREFKKELLYKHGINLNSRITNYMNASGKKTAPKTLSMIHDDELPDCISTAVALCNRNNINISAIINKTA